MRIADGAGHAATTQGIDPSYDRTSQYCSIDDRVALRNHGVLSPVSGPGNCLDSAEGETFFKAVMSELIWPVAWQTRRQAENAVAS